MTDQGDDNAANDNADDYLYRADRFRGRAGTIQRLITSLDDDKADEKQRRCVMIEAPGRQGKSWLLYKVRDELAKPAAGSPPSTRVLFVQGQDFKKPAANPGKSRDFGDLSFDFLAHLLTAVFDLIPADLLPSELVTPDHQPPTAAALLAIRDQHSLATQLHMVVQALERSPAPVKLLLIVDGMDEIPLPMLQALERQFVAVLFECPRVRLLASRRIKSVTHRWRELKIRRQQVFERLDEFDAPQEQIDFVLAEEGSALRFADLRAQLGGVYTWQNPGANRCMAYHLVRHSRISRDHIGTCLRTLMQNQATGPIDDETFGQVRRIVAQYGSDLKAGIPRYELETIFPDLMPGNRDDLIGRLQERGVAQFDGPNMLIHADIVELFAELQAKEAL